jgi:hypothetical protein
VQSIRECGGMRRFNRPARRREHEGPSVGWEQHANSRSRPLKQQTAALSVEIAPGPHSVAREYLLPGSAA